MNRDWTLENNVVEHVKRTSMAPLTAPGYDVRRRHDYAYENGLYPVTRSPILTSKISIKNSISMSQRGIFLVPT